MRRVGDAWSGVAESCREVADAALVATEGLAQFAVDAALFWARGVKAVADEVRAQTVIRVAAEKLFARITSSGVSRAARRFGLVRVVMRVGPGVLVGGGQGALATVMAQG